MVPWAFAAVLIFLGFGLERRIRPPRFAAGLLHRVRLARTLGWLTPLIPCGPLWIMFGAAALTATWHGGASHMLAFALGTIPLPWLVQAQAHRLQQFLSPRKARLTQQFLAFGSAGLLIWRTAIPLHACCH
jgi:sulfite exporter TauE/SafE